MKCPRPSNKGTPYLDIVKIITLYLNIVKIQIAPIFIKKGASNE
jgi:hypothetical protein